MIFFLVLLNGCSGISTSECLTCSAYVYNGHVYRRDSYSSENETMRVAKLWCTEQGMGDASLGYEKKWIEGSYYQINCSPKPQTVKIESPADLTPYVSNCKSLGFEKGTQEFGNCVMKLLEVHNKQVIQQNYQSDAELQKHKAEQAEKNKKILQRFQILQQLDSGNTNALQSSQRGNAFLKQDFISGLNRICVYDRLGSDDIVTIPSTSICPLSR